MPQATEGRKQGKILEEQDETSDILIDIFCLHRHHGDRQRGNEVR